ncbi:XrtA system polysaccharide chain length determinant [uncultured Sphingomonas sp.]|uniref:XrtA system polysaccharide chain length determinant n=1 Tax=uncultured Sphingomonas sp. TaxID=158754 RepID=UPI0035CAC363
MTGLYDEARLALHAVWTRRWLALAVAWGVCVLGWLVVSQMPSRYESHARVFVQLGSILPDSVGQPATPPTVDVDTIRQTLTSAVNLEKVVRGSDLAGTVSSDRDVADRVAGLAQNIKIVSQQDNLFEITTTAASPGLARSITRTLIDIFVADNIAGDRTQTSTSLGFLDKQLDGLQKQLQDAETKRADFQNRYLGSLPGTGSVSDRIGAARNQLAQVEGDLAAAQSSLAVVQGQMGGTPQSVPGLGGGAGAGPARARLTAIQGQLADARARGYTDNHPDVIALKSQLAAAQVAARGEPLVGGAAGGSVNPLYLSLQSMSAEKQSAVAALRMRRAQLQGDLDQLNEKLAADPEAAAEQGGIDRTYQVLKTQYDQLLTQRQQIALRGDAQTQGDDLRFKVIDPPTAPRAPSAPNRMLLLTGVLIVGLAAGIGAAFAMGQLRATFTTATKLERATGMPVIGSIGEVVTRAQADHRTRRLKHFAGGAGALLAAYVLLLAVEIVQRGMAA